MFKLLKKLFTKKGNSIKPDVMRKFSYYKDLRHAYYHGWLQCCKDHDIKCGEVKPIKRTDFDEWEKKTYA